MRGSIISFTVTIKDSGGTVLAPEVCSDIKLCLGSSRSASPLCEYSIGSGITSLGDGQYSITIPRADTLLLPVGARAYLQGWITPGYIPITFNLGEVMDNAHNRYTHE